VKNNSPKSGQNKVKREFSAGFIVFSRDQDNQIEYLLLHYPGGHFDFAKGHLEKGETEMQAALRELEEETGLKNIKVIDGYCENLDYYFSKRGQKIFKKVTFFLAETAQKEIKISFEHRGSLWLPYAAALQKTTFQNAKDLLKKAHQFLENNKIIHGD